MAEQPELTQQDVMALCAKYMNEEHLKFVQRAYDFAAYVHKDQYRKSGEPYIIHPIQVAGILANLKMDPETVASRRCGHRGWADQTQQGHLRCAQG